MLWSVLINELLIFSLKSIVFGVSIEVHYYFFPWLVMSVSTRINELIPSQISYASHQEETPEEKISLILRSQR